jgi:HEAT repeat protein
MTLRGRAAWAALALGLWAPSTRAVGPLSLAVPAGAAQQALALELAPDGLWFQACATAPCRARAGRREELPPAAQAALASATLELLQLGPEQRVAHARIPLPDGVAWEALIAPGSAQPSVVFAGLTGPTRGEDGQREGDVIWLRNDQKGRRILVGREREDVQLCGRPTLLEPRLLDRDSNLQAVKVQQLSLEERRAARVLEAVPMGTVPTPGGNALRAVAASSAIGDPGALTDSRDQSSWAEARGGDGRGEFVVLRALSGVSLVALEFLVRPALAAADGAARAGSELRAAPRSLWIATRGDLFRVDWGQDAWRAPGVWYRVVLPAPIQTDCLALVLEQAWSERADIQVSLAELRGVGELQSLAPAELVARLSTPGDVGAAAVPALLQLETPGIVAVVGAFDALDALGRARALDVLERAPCETTAAVYAGLLDDGDANNRRRAEQRLRACGAAAEPALRRAFELGSGEGGVLLARELAQVAPRLAVELLGPRLAASAPEQRPGYRDALSRAAREASAQAGSRRLLEARGLGLATQLDVLRALNEQLPSLEPEASSAFVRALAAARGFEQRYLLLAPASVLGSTSPAAAAFLEEALSDPDPYLRGAAARLAPRVARVVPALVAATRDPGVRVREAATARLGELALPGTSAALSERLRADGWPLVRSAAARSLARVGPDADADAALSGALGDASSDVRGAALRGLGQRGVRAAVPQIAERFRDVREAPAVRAAAARALADLCDPSQLDELTRAARALLADRPSPDEVVVGGAALAALGRIAPVDIERRLAAFHELKSRPALEQLVDAARHTAERCAASRVAP